MTQSVTQLDPQELITLLSQQRDLYARLRALSEQQRSLIAGDRPDMLLNILRDRQDLVTALARLNERLGPFRRNWDTLYAGLPDAERTRASALLQEINALLRGILRADQEDSALLSARKQTVAQELASTAGGQQANAAYQKQGGTAPPPQADLAG